MFTKKSNIICCLHYAIETRSTFQSICMQHTESQICYVGKQDAYNVIDCIATSPLGGIYRSTRLGGQGTSPRDKEGYHGITSILNYHIWSCLIYSNNKLLLSISRQKHIAGHDNTKLQAQNSSRFISENNYSRYLVPKMRQLLRIIL